METRTRTEIHRERPIESRLAIIKIGDKYIVSVNVHPSCVRAFFRGLEEGHCVGLSLSENPPFHLPFHDSSQFFFELFVSNFTSPPSDPILFLFPRLSLCHSWSRRAPAPLFFYPRIVLVPSPSFLFSGPPRPSVVSSFLSRPSSSLVPSFTARWLHLLVPSFPPHEAKTLFSRGPFSSTVSATLLSFSPLLSSPLLSYLHNSPILSSLPLSLSPPLGHSVFSVRSMASFYPLSFSSLPLLILHAAFPFPPGRCAFYVFPTLSTFFLGSSRTFSFRRTIVPIVPSASVPSYRHSRDDQPALSPGKRKRKRLLPSWLVFQSELRF